MAVKMAINGFGRIGRQVLKATLERYPNDIEVVAVHDLVGTAELAHLFTYDSNYGRFPGEVISVTRNCEVESDVTSIIPHFGRYIK